MSQVAEVGEGLWDVRRANWRAPGHEVAIFDEHRRGKSPPHAAAGWTHKAIRKYHSFWKISSQKVHSEWI